MLVVVVRLDGKPRWPLFTVLNLLVHEVYATVTARLLWNRGWFPAGCTFCLRSADPDIWSGNQRPAIVVERSVLAE